MFALCTYHRVLARDRRGLGHSHLAADGALAPDFYPFQRLTPEMSSAKIWASQPARLDRSSKSARNVEPGTSVQKLRIRLVEAWRRRPELFVDVLSYRHRMEKPMVIHIRRIGLLFVRRCVMRSASARSSSDPWRIRRHGPPPVARRPPIGWRPKPPAKSTVLTAISSPHSSLACEDTIRRIWRR